MRQQLSKTVLKKVFVIVCTMLLCFSFFRIQVSVPASAKNQPNNFVIDDANLLSEKEIHKIGEKCEEISRQHNASICIITTPDFYGDDIKDWQRQYFSEHEMGMGEQHNGIMLAISMADRDWGIVGFGNAQTAFTTYGRERIAEIILDDLSDGDYYESFSKYVSLADEFLTEAESGTPYDHDHKYKENIPIPFIIVGAFLLSVIISLFIVLSWKRSMNTRIHQENASEYLKKDSFSLSNRSDIFLYHTVSRTRRPKEEHHIDMNSDSSGTSGKF
ncbi:MAG: TPM domain-containing protein [Lachnospiraceae bacterium]|nr:TPM domain-containing protein [Lachnospiraceae bacterium]